MTTIGVISDTHGLLRPEAVDYLAGSDLIIHAGDIGSPDVLVGLARIAPVTAIRGNIDKDPWGMGYPDFEVSVVGKKTIYVIHSLNDLDLDPEAAGFDVVVSGHSHIPKAEKRGGVLYLNPGSAGPRRFKLPIALAMLTVREDAIEAEIHEIEL